MLTRSKLWAVGLLIAAFAAGVAVGGAASNALGRVGQIVEGRRPPPPEHRDRGRRGYADRLQEVLGLSEDQRAAVDSILAHHQAQMDTLWGNMRPQFDALRQRITDQILEILTEEQQNTYRELIARENRRGEGERERVPRNP